MIRKTILACALMVLSIPSAFAVENVVSGSYYSSVPTDVQVSNWNEGWAQPATQPTGYTNTTGWNYVGQINSGNGTGNSATYLGNGWVLGAAHVGPGDFSLNSVNYPMVPNSAHYIGNADLILFQVYPSPALPPLTFRSTDPSGKVVMIGYGHTDGSRTETWGCNTVSVDNQTVPLSQNGSSYSSNDFETYTDKIINKYQVVIGDSGGADFIYNSATKTWELAGINEADGTLSNGVGVSAFVQLPLSSNPSSSYAAQIQQIMATVGVAGAPDESPTMPQWGLIALAGLLFWAAHSTLTPAQR